MSLRPRSKRSKQIITSAFIGVAFAATGCVHPAAITYASRASAADTLARRAIQSERSLNAASIPQNTLSVAPLAVLTTDTTYSSLGFGIAALLTTDLSKSASLVMVERLKFDAVLRELQLAESGRVDTNTAPRVGKLVGARQVVLGTVDFRTRNSVRVQSYVANTVTGKVGSSLAGNATLTQIFDAEKSLVFRLFDVLGVTLTPAERRDIEQHSTRSLVAFIAFSRGSRAEAFGDFAAATANYQEAIRLDPSFAAAAKRISELQPPLVATNLFPLITVPLGRASTITADLINRPLPIAFGTGADAAVSSRQQIVTFTVIIRTP